MARTAARRSCRKRSSESLRSVARLRWRFARYLAINRLANRCASAISASVCFWMRRIFAISALCAARRFRLKRMARCRFISRADGRTSPAKTQWPCATQWPADAYSTNCSAEPRRVLAGICGPSVLTASTSGGSPLWCGRDISWRRRRSVAPRYFAILRWDWLAGSN